MPTSQQILEYINTPAPRRFRAPEGMFRVIGVDTFEGPTEDYLIGDFADISAAEKCAREHGGEMNPVYVYDSTGKLLFRAGSY